MLAEAQQRADAFAERHAGRVAELDGPGLIEAMTELGGLQDLVDARRHLRRRCTSRPTPPTRPAARSTSGSRSTRRRSRRSSCSSSSSGPRSTTSAPTSCSPPTGLDFCRHHLRTARRYRPHLLSEPEEKILTEKALTSRNAWGRLFEEQVAALEVQLEDGAEPVSLEVALSRLHLPDREARAHAAERVTEALAPGLRTRGFVFNTLLADKMVDDRLRNYPHWLASRNLANEASDESVEALVTAVRNRYEVTRRWYRLKAKLLGVDRLADYDRMAAVTDENPPVTWREARELVEDSYSSFSPELGNLVRRFFDERWIDAPVRPGKRAGAFCAYGVAVRAPVRDAQLDLAPPRRADARARARPRRPRRARRAARASSTWRPR